MRFLTYILVALLALVQVELWFGKAGMSKVMDLESKLTVQQRKNDSARARNDVLAAEVSDLKEGLEMVEEKARYELGMIKPDEIFVHVSTKQR